MENLWYSPIKKKSGMVIESKLLKTSKFPSVGSVYFYIRVEKVAVDEYSWVADVYSKRGNSLATVKGGKLNGVELALDDAKSYVEIQIKNGIFSVLENGEGVAPIEQVEKFSIEDLIYKLSPESIIWNVMSERPVVRDGVLSVDKYNFPVSINVVEYFNANKTDEMSVSFGKLIDEVTDEDVLFLSFHDFNLLPWEEGNAPDDALIELYMDTDNYIVNVGDDFIYCPDVGEILTIDTGWDRIVRLLMEVSDNDSLKNQLVIQLLEKNKAQEIKLPVEIGQVILLSNGDLAEVVELERYVDEEKTIRYYGVRVAFNGVIREYVPDEYAGGEFFGYDDLAKILNSQGSVDESKDEEG